MTRLIGQHDQATETVEKSALECRRIRFALRAAAAASSACRWRRGKAGAGAGWLAAAAGAGVLPTP